MSQIPLESINSITERIIGAAIEVHRGLGPGLLESVYEECLAYELGQSGLRFQRQLQVPIRYKDLSLPGSYRIDLFVENLVVVEIKAVEVVIPVHEAQILSYMKILDAPAGLLVNFTVPLLAKGA